VIIMSDEIKKMLDEQFKTVHEQFEKNEKQVAEMGKASEKDRAELNAKLKDHEDLVNEMKTQQTAFQDALTAIQQKGVKLQSEGRPATVGQQVVESEQFKAFKGGNTPKMRFETKNTIIGEGGSPQNPTDDIVPKDYMSGIVPGAFRQLNVMDVVPKGATSSNTVHYTRELLFTNAAAETAEAGSKPETTLTFEGVEEYVRTVAHFIKASKQVLDDAPFLSSYIDRRMRYGVNLRMEQQIITGNGTSPNMSGIATTGNHTDLTIVTADNDFDAANRAKIQILSADYMPSVFLINPADWGRLERTKTGISGDNTYLGGTGGAISYINNGMQPMLWGLPVVASNSVTAGNFFCMSNDAWMLVNREGVAVEMFEQDDTNVQSNLLTIRAEARATLCTFQPSAIVYGAWPDA